MYIYMGVYVLRSESLYVIMRLVSRDTDRPMCLSM
jgi:hypothetical protein